MASLEFVRKLNLPKIPQSIVPNLDDFKSLAISDYNYDWTDKYNKQINKFCQENVCDTGYFGFQIISGYLQKHKDIQKQHTGMITSCKLVYHFDLGGTDVITQFWEDDKKTLVKEYKMDLHEWYLINVGTYHSVTGIEKNRIRIAVTGQMMHNYLQEQALY